MKTIIAFTGAQKSGKSFFANALANELINVETMSFADPLKEVLENLFPSCNYEIAKKREVMPGLSGRDLMIALAKRAKELYGGTYFANLLIQRINESEEDIIIIDDLRFKVEEEVLKTLPYRVLIVKIKSEFKDDYEVEEIEPTITINNKHRQANVNEVIKTILSRLASQYFFSSRTPFPESEMGQKLYMVYDSLKKIFDIPNVRFYVIGNEIIKAQVNIRGRKIPITESVLEKAIALAGQRNYLYVKEG